MLNELTFDNIVKFKNSKEFIELDKYYKNPRILDFFNYYGQENPHTNFLANLFKIDNPYTNDDKPFKLLLGLLSINAEKQHIKKYEIFRDVYLNFEKVNNLKVSSQKELIPKVIPDITIEFEINNQNYIIILEAKVNAEENVYPDDEHQTSLYRKAAEGKDDIHNYEKCYVFLSPGIKPHDKNWISISYQDLLDYVLVPCANEYSNIDVPITINEYINSYSYSYSKEDKGITRLAITPKEKELVELIWEKNKEILKIIKDNMLLKETHKTIPSEFFLNNCKILFSIFSVLNYISKAYVSDDDLKNLKNSRPECYFEGKIYYGITDFVYDVVNDIIEKKKIDSFNSIPIRITGANYNCPRLFLNEVPDKCKVYVNEKKNEKHELKIPGSNQKLLYATVYNHDELISFVNDVTREYEEYKNRIKLQS